MLPIAKVVATELPLIAAKIMQVTTQVAGSPPCTPPTIERANSTRRREMPPTSIRLPARMKNGIAASGNLSSATNNCCAATISGKEVKPAMPMTAAMPIASATGMLRPRTAPASP